MSNEKIEKNISPGLHLRRACDLLASKVRSERGVQSSIRIASNHLGVPYQSLISYANDHNPVPIELAKQMDAIGYPKHLLRPDVWEE